MFEFFTQPPHLPEEPISDEMLYECASVFTALAPVLVHARPLNLHEATSLAQRHKQLPLRLLQLLEGVGPRPKNVGEAREYAAYWLQSVSEGEFHPESVTDAERLWVVGHIEIRRRIRACLYNALRDFTEAALGRKLDKPSADKLYGMLTVVEASAVQTEEAQEGAQEEAQEEAPVEGDAQ